MRNASVRALGCAVALAVLALGCGAEPAPDDTAPATTGDGGATAPPVQLPADPAPEPFADRIESADILITSQSSLPSDLVDRVREVPGVEATEVFSLAQLPIENRLYTVASVDVSSYRRFTPAESAQLDSQWERVAGGEVAVRPRLRERLPIDEAGNLSLAGFGTTSDEAEPVRVHVGAYSNQMTSIDAVVNRAWGAELGIVEDNALAISTRLTAPDEVRKGLRGVLADVDGAEESLSVQNLDIVARRGLDPDAVQIATLVGSYAEAVGRFTYRSTGGGRIAPDPAWVSDRIVTDTVPILGRVTCNRTIFPQLKAALGEIVDRGLANEINPDEYAGCYYPRFIAGSTQLSNHAFGLALDLNVPGNLRGTVGEMDRDVVAIFKKWGFGWGGDWGYTDPMHFELRAIVEPS